MRIKEIIIQNFKNHKDTTLTPKTINFIYGEQHGSGTSTILDAITLALTNSIPYANLLEFVGPDNTESTIKLKLEHKGEEFNIEKRISNNGKITSKGLSPNLLARKIGVTPKTLLAVCNSWYVTKYSSSSDINEIISQMNYGSIDSDTSYQNIISLVDDKELANSNIFKEAAQDVVSTLNRSSKDPFVSLNNKCTNTIKNFNKQINTIDESINSLMSIDMPKNISVSDAINISKYNDMKDKLEHLQQEVDAKSNKVKLPDDFHIKQCELEREIEDLEKSIDYNNNSILLSKNKKDRVLRIISTVKDQHDKNNQKDNKDIPCPYSPHCLYDDIIDVVFKNEEYLLKLQDNADTICSKIEDIENATNDLYVKLKILKNNKFEMDNLLNEVGSKHKHITNAKEEINDLRIQIRNLETDIPTDVNMDNLPTEEEINNSIKDESERDLLNKQKDDLKHSISIYEKIKDIVTSDKFAEPIVYDRLDDFKEYFKLLCSDLLNFPVYIDNNNNIVFGRKGGPSSASESEKYRIGIAYQTALSKFSDINIVLLDGIEILTSAKSELDNYLSRIASDIDINNVFMTTNSVETFLNDKKIFNSIEEEDKYLLRVHIKDGTILNRTDLW